MKILFIENRDKTVFWSSIAAYLETLGVETHFLVQNPVYMSSAFGRVHRIPPPSEENIRSSFSAIPNATVDYLQKRDRGFKYFGSGNRHYGYYYEKTLSTIKSIKPDIVVGECTLFHELIALSICKEFGVRYVHPVAARYPSGRFQLFESDTQNVALSSGDKWEETEIQAFLTKMTSGRLQPSYMSKAGSLKQKCSFYWFRYRSMVKVTVGRLLGEKFNTPSILKKLALWLKLKRSLYQWDRISKGPPTGKNIVYLLQMQPEANIDVWGQPFSDQGALLQEVASNLPEGYNLLVKSNPKAKYEIFDLFDKLMSFKNVYFLPRRLTMNDLRHVNDGVITVCGTVGFESVFTGSRCVALRHPAIDKITLEYTAANAEKGLTRLVTGRSQPATPGLPKKLIESLIADSFDGEVGDPVYNKGALGRDNVRKVAKVLLQCAQALSTSKI